jgi:hypothetical protein
MASLRQLRHESLPLSAAQSQIYFTEMILDQMFDFSEIDMK